MDLCHVKQKKRITKGHQHTVCSQVQSGENSEKELLKAINTRSKHCFIYSIYLSSILGSLTLNRSFQANQAWYDSIESIIFKIRFNRNMISLRLRLEFYLKKTDFI